MTRPKKVAGSGERAASARASATPARETEEEIVAEVGAVRDETSGELLASEDAIRTIGALDAESVRENRRMEDVANKKKGNMPRVPFGTQDIFTMYEIMLKTWPANTIDIMVRRTTGLPVQQVITSRPRTGAELYAAIQAIHGQHPEAEYEVRFLDNGNKQWKGTGKIAMPDTRPQAPQQGGLSMQPPYYQPPYGAPPQGYPQQPSAAPPYPPQQGAPAQAAPAQPPPVQVLAPPPQPNPMDMMQQAFELFMRMQHAQQPQPQAPMPQPAPSVYPTDPMQMMQEMFRMFQQMQQTQQAAQPPARGQQPAQQPQTNPMSAMMGMMGMMPPMQPPPGHIWVPPFGFVSLEKLMQAMGGGAPDRRPSYGPGSSYGRPRGEDPSHPHRPPPPPPRERSISDQLQEALSVVQTAVSSVQQINNIIPGMVPGQGSSAPEPQEEDDSPVRVVDIGPAKAAVGEDGSTLVFESLMANSDKIFGWLGEQYDKFQKSKQQQQQQAPAALPPGHVIVTPGYEPPPGYRLGPPDPRYVQHAQQPPPAQPPQSPLPPPPANVPPPVNATASTAPPQPYPMWEMPEVQDEEEAEG